MGLLDDLQGRKVYFDTNVFIYAVEAVPEYASAVDALFDLIEAGEVAAFTSELTLAEALAKPFEAERDEIARLYQEMLAPSSWLSVPPVDRPLLIEAARLQARLGLRLPDAIHVATAVAAGCDTCCSRTTASSRRRTVSRSGRLGSNSLRSKAPHVLLTAEALTAATLPSMEARDIAAAGADRIDFFIACWIVVVQAPRSAPRA